MEFTHLYGNVLEKAQDMMTIYDHDVHKPLSTYEKEFECSAKRELHVEELIWNLPYDIPCDSYKKRNFTHFNFRLLSQLPIAIGFYYQIQSYEGKELSHEKMIGLQYCYGALIKTICVTTAILATEYEYAQIVNTDNIESLLKTMLLILKSPETFANDEINMPKVTKVCSDSSYALIQKIINLFEKHGKSLFEVSCLYGNVKVYKKFLPLNLFEIGKTSIRHYWPHSVYIHDYVGFDNTSEVKKVIKKTFDYVQLQIADIFGRKAVKSRYDELVYDGYIQPEKSPHKDTRDVENEVHVYVYS